MKGRLKHFVFKFLYYSGLEWLLLKLVGFGGAGVVMFHSVGQGSVIPRSKSFAMPVDVFEEKLRFLGRYQVLGLDELYGAIKNGRPMRNAVCLTFDDGYEDNYLNAYPLLKKYGLQAAVFLTTDYIGGRRWLPLNEIYFLIASTGERSLTLEIGGEGVSLSLEGAQDREAARVRVSELMKGAGAEMQREIHRQVVEQLSGGVSPGDPGGELRMLDWDQVREMAASGLITIGSHGCSHTIVSRLEPEQARAEFRDSKERIEAEIRRPVRHFCYPNGRREDFGPEHEAMLRELGYRTACTTLTGTNGANANPLELRRFTAKTPDYELACELLFGPWRGI